MISEYKALALNSGPYWLAIVLVCLLRIVLNGDFSLQVFIGFPALLTVMLVTGYSVCKALRVQRPSDLETFTLSLVTGITVLIFSSFLLLLCQLFNLFSLLSLTALVAALCHFSGPNPLTQNMTAPAPPVLFFLGIFALALLFATPFEYIWGGTDAAVYIFNAHNYLNKDSISFVDSAVRLFPELFKESTHPNYENLKYAGFYLTDISAGEITPQYFPGYSLLLAIGILFFGDMFLYVNLMMVMILFLSLYLLASQLFSTEWVAWAVAILLVLNVQVIWSARITHTEILTAVMTIMTLYVMVADDSIGRGSETLIVAFYALLLITRVDILFFTFAILAILVVFKTRFSRSLKALIIAVSIGSYFMMLELSGPYIRDIFLFKFAADASQVYVSISIALVLYFLISEARFTAHLIAHATTLLLNRRRVFALLGVTIIVMVFGFLLFLYPDEQYTTYTALQHLGKPLPTYNNQNLLRLGWFVSPLGLLLMMTGLCLLIVKEQNWRWVIVVLYFFPSLYYLYSLSNNPLQIYGFRRYVPGVLVLSYLCIGYALHSLDKKSKRTGAFIFLVLASVTIYPTYKLSSTDWFRGATASLSDLDVIKHSDAVFVAIDDGIAHWHAPTLEYYRGIRHVLPVNMKDLDPALIDKAKQHFDSVFLLAGTDTASAHTAAHAKVTDISISLPALQQGYDSLLTGEQTYRRELTLYRIQ